MRGWLVGLVFGAVCTGAVAAPGVSLWENVWGKGDAGLYLRKGSITYLQNSSGAEAVQALLRLDLPGGGSEFFTASVAVSDCVVHAGVLKLSVAFSATASPGDRKFSFSGESSLDRIAKKMCDVGMEQAEALAVRLLMCRATTNAPMKDVKRDSAAELACRRLVEDEKWLKAVKVPK